MKVKASRLSSAHPAGLWGCGALRLMWMSHSICCRNEAPQDVWRMEGSGSGHSYQGKAHRPEMLHLHGFRPLLLGSLPSDLQAGALWPWNLCIWLACARELCNSAWALLPLFLKQHIHPRYGEHTEIPHISDLHSQVHNTTQSFCFCFGFLSYKADKRLFK